MVKKYNKITLKSLNELKESFGSPSNDETINVLKEISAWVLTNKAVKTDNKYTVCGGKYWLESTFNSFSDDSSKEDAELFIHFIDSTNPDLDKSIYILYDYDYSFETQKTGVEGDSNVGHNDVTQKKNENEEFEISEITMYEDGSDVAMIHNPNEYSKEVINIIKSTNFK